jgi:hypothetical protein
MLASERGVVSRGFSAIGRFKDVSSEMGPSISEHSSSRGAAFGDYDNDGDIDALVLTIREGGGIVESVRPKIR